MFQIKICGLTNAADAIVAADAGADAIGLNFYSGSRRYVDPHQAYEITRKLPSHVAKVGVFVNATTHEVNAACDRYQLDMIQLHGDEPPEQLSDLTGHRRELIRAFRCRRGNGDTAALAEVLDYLQECRRLNCLPQMVLLDAYLPGRYGGTGQVADWRLAASYHETGAEPALVLAGGLSPDNVADAIRIVRPAAVDVAGGVESAAGQKDAAKIKAFVAAARDALSKV